MRAPNFFIAGAPKCGITTVAEWLRQHQIGHWSYYWDVIFRRGEVPR